MTSSVQIAIVALLGLLVGGLIPLLWSAFALLRRARQTLTLLEARALEIGEQTSRVLGHVEHISAELEQDLPSVHRSAERLDALGTQIDSLTGSLRKGQAIVATIGPAVAAGIQAYREVAAARAESAASAPNTNVDSDSDNDLPTAVSDAILAQVKADMAAER